MAPQRSSDHHYRGQKQGLRGKFSRWLGGVPLPGLLQLWRRMGASRVTASVLWTTVGFLVGLFILAMVSAGEIYNYQDSVDGAHLPKVDAIVCLAGGRGRISASGDLWYRYWEQAPKGPKGVRKVPVLYFSGVGHQSNFSVLSRQLRRGVLDDLKPDHVIVETVSTNTDENAKWVLRHAMKLGWKRILLVTSRYHMRRSLFIFDEVFKGAGSPVQIESMSVYLEPFEPGEWRDDLHGIRVTLTEYFKWLYYTMIWKP